MFPFRDTWTPAAILPINAASQMDAPLLNINELVIIKESPAPAVSIGELFKAGNSSVR